MSDDLESEDFEAAAMDYMLHNAWQRWAIRLALGIMIVVGVIMKWPDLWWVALVYAPAPVLSAVVNIRLKREIGGSASDPSDAT